MSYGADAALKGKPETGVDAAGLGRAGSLDPPWHARDRVPTQGLLRRSLRLKVSYLNPILRRRRFPSVELRDFSVPMTLSMTCSWLSNLAWASRTLSSSLGKLSFRPLIATNTLTTMMPILMARPLLRTFAAWITPCSVNAHGRYWSPPRPFEVAICDLKESRSSLVKRNAKSPGNLSRLRLICSFRRFVLTP